MPDEKIQQGTQSQTPSNTSGQQPSAKPAPVQPLTPQQENEKAEKDFGDAFAPEPKTPKKSAEKGNTVKETVSKKGTTVKKPEESGENTDDKNKQQPDNKDEQGKENGEQSKETPKTAQQKLEERANNALTPEEKKQQAEAEKQKQAEAEKARLEAEKKAKEASAPRKPIELTPEIAKKFHDDLANNSEMKQFAADYPDEFKVITAAVMHGAKKLIEEFGLGGAEGQVTAKDIQDIRNELGYYKFITAVSRKHPDVHEIQESKEFIEWIGKQPKGVQRLAESNDPEDAGYVLDAYKEVTGKAKAESELAKAQAEKAKRDALLEDDGTTVSDTSLNNKDRLKEGKNDFGAGFDEA